MKNHTINIFIENLKNLMNQHHLDYKQLGKKSQVSSRMIQYVINKERKPSLEIVEKVAKAFNKTAAQLITKSGDEIKESAAEYIVTTNNLRTPITGTAQLGPDGYWHELTGIAEGHIDAPTNDPDAYSIKVVGDSMRPALKSGWYVVCEPNHDVVIGEFVLVQTTSGKSMVKELLIANDLQYVLGSINEDYGRITIDPQDVEKIHYVAFIAPPSKHSI